MEVYIEVAVNAESFHHLDKNRRFSKYLQQHCKVLRPVGRKPMNFVLTIDLFGYHLFSHACFLFNESCAYATQNKRTR